MENARRTYRRYIALLLAPAVAAALGIGASLLVLERVGERVSPPKIAESLQATGGLYGSALHDDAYAFKLALAARRQPQVAIVGSSRTLTVASEFFAVPTANLGLMASSTRQLEAAVNDVLAVARPQLLVLGIDFFWFHPQWAGPFVLSPNAELSRKLTPNKLLAPYRWLALGQIRPDEAFAALAGRPPNLLAVPAIGWRARSRGDGYAADGQYVYGSQIFGRRPADDEGFADTLDRIARGTSQFRHGREIDADAFAPLARTIARLRGEGIAVVTYLPPLAPIVDAAMRAQPERYAYVDAVRARMAALSPQHLDATDIAPLGANDCEFVDGFHAGAVASARVLAALASTDLGRYLDAGKIADAIATHAGKVATDLRYARPGEREVNFLGLPCK